MERLEYSNINGLGKDKITFLFKKLNTKLYLQFDFISTIYYRTLMWLVISTPIIILYFNWILAILAIYFNIFVAVLISIGFQATLSEFVSFRKVLLDF